MVQTSISALKFLETHPNCIQSSPRVPIHRLTSSFYAAWSFFPSSKIFLNSKALLDDLNNITANQLGTANSWLAFWTRLFKSWISVLLWDSWHISSAKSRSYIVHCIHSPCLPSSWLTPRLTKAVAVGLSLISM